MAYIIVAEYQSESNLQKTLVNFMWSILVKILIKDTP